MADSKRKFVTLCLCTMFVTGCTSVKVVPNPGEGDTGIRFFRPKPYLLVTPADPTGRLVNLKLEYLPDFNEEYSAHVRGKASVALKDGWNLVGVNTKEAPKDKEEPPAKIEDIKLPQAVVAASNVPIGYYESVYGYNGPKKFLQGWRYIGMTSLGGGTPNVCRVPGHSPTCPKDGTKDNGCINGPLYGLVFFNGAMTFRQLDEIANNQLCPMYVNPAPAEVAPPKEQGKTDIDSQVAPKGTDIRSATPPPTPSPTTPPPTPNPGVIPPPISLTRPTVTPALVKVSPAKPSASSVPAAAPGVYQPIARKATARIGTGTLAKIPASKPPVLTAPGLDQDPLSKMPPSFDQDLYRTGTSPRP